MGLLETVSDWLEPPSYVVYRCSRCGAQSEQARSPCPECGEEVAADPIPVDDWEPM